MDIPSGSPAPCRGRVVADAEVLRARCVEARVGRQAEKAVELAPVYWLAPAARAKTGVAEATAITAKIVRARSAAACAKSVGTEVIESTGAVGTEAACKAIGAESASAAESVASEIAAVETATSVTSSKAISAEAATTKAFAAKATTEAARPVEAASEASEAASMDCSRFGYER